MTQARPSIASVKVGDELPELSPDERGQHPFPLG